MSLILTSDQKVNQTAQCRGKKLMDKYMIVFRWLAQVGGAMAAALKPLGQLQYYPYTHCVPAVFLVLLISLKLTASVIQNIQLSGHPLVPLCPDN